MHRAESITVSVSTWKAIGPRKTLVRGYKLSERMKKSVDNTIWRMYMTLHTKKFKIVELDY